MASEETKAEVSDNVIKAVAERLQFFFSDANVRADSFMRLKLLKSEGGYVPIDVLLKFNSIKQHTTDPSVVVTAAKTIGTLVLAEDEKSIARKTPFTMSMMNDNIALSLYVSNVPITEAEDDKPAQYAVKMEDVRALFEPYGDVTLVKLRFKRADGDNKKRNVPVGAAFVEFSTEEQLSKAAEEVLTKKGGEIVEAKKTLILGGNTLEVVTMKEWLDEKKKKEPDGNKESPKKRDRDEKPAEVEVEEFNIDWKKGCVIKVKGLAADCDREAIRAAVAKGMGKTEKELKELGVYADFSRGQTEGAIRFNEPDASIGELARKLANGEVEIAGAKVDAASILEGDDETKYWADFIEFKNKQLKHRAEERVSRKKSRR